MDIYNSLIREVEREREREREREQLKLQTACQKNKASNLAKK